MTLKAPFPWFGGKSKVAHIVWDYFGDTLNYVEPFFGSGAVLLGRPENHAGHIETVNDLDGYVANAWRAIAHDPEGVTRWADWPITENDLHARHVWLLQYRDQLRPLLEGDPEYHDSKIAGWWLYGMAAWIGSGFCSGKGPWQNVDGRLVKVEAPGAKGQVPRLTGTQGIQRKRVQLGNGARGTNRKLIHLGDAGRGIARQRQQLKRNGQGFQTQGDLYDYMRALCERMRRVRVTCGDWSRVCGKLPTYKLGLTAVFLDPPYGAEANRISDIYNRDSLELADSVREWAIANGNNPLMRIALCGYSDEHDKHMPDNWTRYSWSANGGYDGQNKNGTNDNRHKEVIYFSPHCLKPESQPEQLALL